MRDFARRGASRALLALALALAVAPTWAWGSCGRVDSGYSISGDVLASYSIMSGYGSDARARNAKTCRSACKGTPGCVAWYFHAVKAKVSGKYCTLYSSYDSEDYEGMYSDQRHWAGLCY